MGKKIQYEKKVPRDDPSYKRKISGYAAKKYRKGTPVITKLEFEGAADAPIYVDLAAALSALNRRMYRQGHYYYVQSVELYNDENKTMDLYTAPDTWMTKAAYARGKAIWENQQSIVGDKVGRIYGKYTDFKVYLSKDQTTLVTPYASPVLYSAGGVAGPVYNNDWDFSLYVDGNNNAAGTDEFTAHLVGTHSGTTGSWASIGLIRSYNETRARVDIDQPVLDSDIDNDPLININDASADDQFEEILTNMEAQNDEPPYQYDNMVGEDDDHLQHQMRLATDGNFRVAHGGGLCAPCGLILVKPEAGTGSAWRIVFNMAVGTYNGIYAERMA